MNAEPAPAEGTPTQGDATSQGDRPYAEGDVLDGRYRLVSLLGRGGFGDVWRADELLPDGTPFRQVALKLLAPHVTDAASWVEEAKLLASFRHPSLVTIFATGVFQGAGPQPFVAMELLEGCTLADVLQDKGPTPWRRVLAWAREAAGALDVIHERGVVHLDLKPANLFLSKDGTIKVLDFGIARKAKPPVGRPREEKAEPPSSRLSYLMPPPRAGAGQASADATRSPSLLGVLSRREAELGTAAFMVEQAIGVNEGAAGAIAGAAATGSDAAQNHTPEAYAQTFAMGATTDALGATHAIGATTARAIIGTPGYMAPEIFEQSEPSAATDAYALGVVIAVLTTGQLPLDVPEEPEGGWSNPTAITSWWAAIRTATLRGEMRDLRQGKAHLPAGLVRLLRKLFAVDAASRGVVPGKLGALLDEVWERPFGVPDPPFPGAVAMSTEHEGFLFGREEEITRLGRDLEHEPCVVLLGPRAVGRTSLALAGLVPHLGKRAVDGKDDWRAVVLRDPARGDAALDEALSAVDEKLAGASIEDVVAFCEASREGLAIVVDPLEALASASVEARARLSELLSSLGDGHVRPGLRVLGVLGEQSVAAVQTTAFGQALRASMRYVGPPSPQSAAVLVNRPIKLARAEATGIEPIISEVQREVGVPGLLPFVAQALADFWAARERVTEPKERIVLRGQRWNDLRGVVGAIGRAGDAALEAMSNADRALAEELLLFLTATDGTLVKWREDELLEAFGRDGQAAERVLATLVDAGLVRRQDATIELLHEGIVEGWRRLQSLRHRHFVRLAFVERLSRRASTSGWWSRTRPDRGTAASCRVSGSAARAAAPGP